MNLDTTIILQSSSLIIYIALMSVVLWKRGLQGEYARGVLLFLLVSLLIGVGNLLPKVDLIQPMAFGDDENFAVYGIFLCSVILRHLSAALTRRTRQAWRWSIVGVVWLLLTVGMNFVPTSADGLIVIGVGAVYSNDLIFAALVLGWTIFTLSTVVLVVQGYQHTDFPTVRNRLFLWGMALGILGGGSVLSFLRYESIDLILKILGSFTIAYVALSPRLPHLGVAFRRVINSVVLVTLEFVVYGVCFLGMYSLMLQWDWMTPWGAGALLALLLMIFVNPLLRQWQAWIDRLLFGEEQDIKGILREYGQKISNILDLELLSVVAVDLVRDVLGVDRGMLLLIEFEVGASGERQYRIRQGRKQSDSSFDGLLPAESSIAKVWDQERRTLTKAEIDMLPRYQGLGENTRQWLSKINMDVYVPIHTQDEWVGLLVLGPKSSGASYYAEDIDLLETLAGQTAVALQNARLVESLMRVNKEFRRAYGAMEDAHTKLQRIDRTKSDFISIASHEFRTPLTILSGYSQMLMEAPDIVNNPDYADFLHGIYDGTRRLHEIVESMLEVAKIDMQELVLQSEAVELDPVVRKVCQGHAKALKSRQLNLEIASGVARLPAVQGDVDALKKVFHHLLSNAIKYTPDEGTIVLSGRQVPKGDPHYPVGGVEITIQDTGIGIDPRYTDLIFTKFYQTGDVDLHSSGKTKFKGGGPGLGLAIVRGIVQAHGGRVWVESPGYDEEKNPGSSFFVLLPFASLAGDDLMPQA